MSGTFEVTLCEATVQRWDDAWGRYQPEMCARIAKTAVRVGEIDVPTCYVHERALADGRTAPFVRPTR